MLQPEYADYSMKKKAYQIERTRNTQGIQTQKSILDIAGRLFGEHGFAGTSMRDISRDSGAALGSLVYHFGTKENLYLQTIRRYIVENGKLNSHFEPLLKVDSKDKQAVSNALMSSMRNFMEACHGPSKVEHLAGLYTRVIVDGNAAALDMLLKCFADVQKELPILVGKLRPDWSKDEVAFWMQLMWSLLQYTVVAKDLVMHDMGLKKGYTVAYLNAAARQFAVYCGMPLGLPAPA